MACVATVVVLVSLVYLVWNLIVNIRRAFSAKPKTANPTSRQSWRDMKGVVVVVLLLVGLVIAIILQ